MSDLVPTEIRLRRGARLLEVSFADGSRYELPFEYLRVHSPSAEVKGHGPGQEVLVVGKENVGITAIEPVGARVCIRAARPVAWPMGVYSR